MFPIVNRFAKFTGNLWANSKGLPDYTHVDLHFWYWDLRIRITSLPIFVFIGCIMVQPGVFSMFIYIILFAFGLAFGVQSNILVNPTKVSSISPNAPKGLADILWDSFLFFWKTNGLLDAQCFCSFLKNISGYIQFDLDAKCVNWCQSWWQREKVNPVWALPVLQLTRPWQRPNGLIGQKRTLWVRCGTCGEINPFSCPKNGGRHFHGPCNTGDVNHSFEASSQHFNNPNPAWGYICNIPENKHI